jgi:hypothetical protein
MGPWLYILCRCVDRQAFTVLISINFSHWTHHACVYDWLWQNGYIYSVDIHIALQPELARGAGTRQKHTVRYQIIRTELIMHVVVQHLVFSSILIALEH